MIVQLYLFHMIYWSRSAIIFVKHVKIIFFQVLSINSIELRKGNPGLTQTFSKLKKDITKLISVHDSISKICHCTVYTKQCGRTYCCFVVKVPCNAIMQHKQRLLGQNQFDMFYKKLLLCSHPLPNMNELCTKLK